MNLSPPLPLVFSPGIADPLARVSVYAGTRRVDPARADEADYEPDAVVPFGPPVAMPRVRAALRPSIYGELAAAHSDFIGIVDVAAALPPLQALGVSDAGTPAEIQAIKAGPGYAHAFESLIGRLRQLLDMSEAVRPLDVTLKPSGMCTVSMNDHTRRRVGLHVDSWDRGTAPTRALARNRINVNLGREPRHFLFVNASLCELAKLRDVAFDQYDRVARMVRQLLDETAQLEVTRIQVNPGEGYIAPTDNVIHDATTLERKRLDISLSVLGRIAFRAEAPVQVIWPRAALTHGDDGQVGRPRS